MKYLIYYLENLDCPNCAMEVEEAVNQLDFVDSCNVNFATKKIFINLEDNSKSNINTIISTIYSVDEIRAVDIKDNKQGKIKFFSIKENWNILLGVIIFIITNIIGEASSLYIPLIYVSYIVLGYHLIISSFKNICKGNIFDENFLMMIATVGALLIKQYPEAIAVMLFYEIGELFQDYAVSKSRKSIEAVMDLRSDKVSIKQGGDIITVSPSDASVGDVMVIKPGERVALDGIIVKGNSQVDTSSITGEFVPICLKEDEEILSGYINQTNVIEVRITKPEAESTVSRILDLVQNANSKKAKAEKFITKFAKVYTPIVFALALIIAIVPSIFEPANSVTWIYKALTFLVVSCPCALVISIPLALFAGLGCASKNGVLIKGGNYLEALNNVDTLVFDKTGTMTKGKFSVVNITSLSNKSNEELLKIAAHGESYSTHPIAKSIVREYHQNIDKTIISNYQEIAGYGIKVDINNINYKLGNDKFLIQIGIDVPEVKDIGSVVYIIENDSLLGFIVVGDSIKETASLAIAKFKELGIKKTVMLTGDRLNVAQKIKDKLGIDELHAQLLPDQKVEEVEKLMVNKTNPNKLIAFVGDGMNDAPVLARSDIGISMGGLGSDAAIEASDIVLMEDDPLSIARAIVIAKKTKTILTQNITLTIVIKVIIMMLSILGIANMWWGVFGDVGVSVLAILNAIRALNVKVGF